MMDNNIDRGLKDLEEVIKVVGMCHDALKLLESDPSLAASGNQEKSDNLAGHDFICQTYLDCHGLEYVSESFSKNARLCWGALSKVIFMDIEDNLIALEKGTMQKNPMLCQIAMMLHQVELESEVDPATAGIQAQIMCQAFSFYMEKGLQMAFDSI